MTDSATGPVWQAALVQQVGDLIAEWRKTCSTMGLRWTDKDAAEFIAAGLDGWIPPCNRTHVEPADPAGYDW